MVGYVISVKRRRRESVAFIIQSTVNRRKTLGFETDKTKIGSSIGWSRKTF